MVTVAGLVLVRQRPGTSKGVVFMTLEDETDIANIIVWPKVFEKNRRTVMTARFLAVRGRLQRAGLVIHVVAESFVDLSARVAVAARGRRSFFTEIFRRPAAGRRRAPAQEPGFSLMPIPKHIPKNPRLLAPPGRRVGAIHNGSPDYPRQLDQRSFTTKRHNRG